jgi:hypothetical protein
VDPLAGSLVTKYLVRVWPAGTEAAELQQSEMCSPASVTEGLDGNDRAEIRAVRNWAQSRANVEQVSYSYEICRDSLVAALAGSGSARRDVTPIVSGTAEPGGELARDTTEPGGELAGDTTEPGGELARDATEPGGELAGD